MKAAASAHRAYLSAGIGSDKPASALGYSHPPASELMFSRELEATHRCRPCLPRADRRVQRLADEDATVSRSLAAMRCSLLVPPIARLQCAPCLPVSACNAFAPASTVITLLAQPVMLEHVLPQACGRLEGLLRSGEVADQEAACGRQSHRSGRPHASCGAQEFNSHGHAAQHSGECFRPVAHGFISWPREAQNVHAAYRML